MNHFSWRLAGRIALFLSLTLGLATAADLPTLRRQGTATQLMVDGRPFLMRAGEVDNSSAEPGYLRPCWAKFKAMHMNAVVVPVYWFTLEPVEGKFDFSAVDGLISDARTNGMHLVLLWFGSWKNSMSCYVPAWVKRDTARFPRSVSAAGQVMEMLSPFSPVNRDADVRAFAALLAHLNETDTARTVVMVQVENEIGMIPDARDHSAEANRLFEGEVPAPLMEYLGKHASDLAPELRALWQEHGSRARGTWREVFGAGSAGEEVFMAWYFGTYTQAVAAAGKAEYPIPMYANAALIRSGYQPGQYPSAGPLPHLIDIWRAAAPALDMISPDIYFPGRFADWARLYRRSGNPLFIPETLRSQDASVNALFAFGELDAIGFSPFAIDTISGPNEGFLGESYGLLEQLSPILATQQGRGTTAGFLCESPETKQPQQVRLGDWTLHVRFDRTTGAALADGMVIAVGQDNTVLPVNGGGGRASPILPAGGLGIATGQDEFLFAGTGLTITFTTDEPGVYAGLLEVEEGCFVGGKWQHLRWLDGDQTNQGREVKLPAGHFSIVRAKLYRYR